jgi:acetyl-CoA carboxylase biotin carboxyl carrier protein
MGGLSEREILDILKMVEASSFSELRLETGELKLLVRKGAGLGAVGGTNGSGSLAAAADRLPAMVAEPPAACATPAGSEPAPAGSAPASPEVAGTREGTVSIKSPMLGTAYRRPSPDAPPYVEVGSYVSENDTVCLIEVMKVFTAVKAGVQGHIAEILFENNSMVEYGQPLFLVKPETSAPH